VLAVGLTFERVDDRDQFIDLWRVHMAPYVKEHEHNCLAYELMVADTDPKKVLVFERWASGGHAVPLHAPSCAPLPHAAPGIRVRTSTPAPHRRTQVHHQL
jgi:hypothetical protein